MASHRRGLGALLLRLAVVAGLVVDAYVHLHLAGRYQQAQPAGIGEGTLFRIEGVAAALAAAYLLLRPSRPAYAVAAVVALGGTAAVLLYRYVDVPAVGPLPAMYEPIWFAEKTLSVVAEAIAGVLAVVGFVTWPRGSAHGRAHQL